TECDKSRVLDRNGSNIAYGRLRRMDFLEQRGGKVRVRAEPSPSKRAKAAAQRLVFSAIPGSHVAARHCLDRASSEERAILRPICERPPRHIVEISEQVRVPCGFAHG